MPLRSDRFRELRLSQNLTHEELADRLNVGVRQIHRYESGETDPSADILSRMSQTLGVTADYLLGLTNNPSDHLTEEDLTPMERKLIAAVRRGLIAEALQTFASLSEKKNKPDISAPKPVINN